MCQFVFLSICVSTIVSVCVSACLPVCKKRNLLKTTFTISNPENPLEFTTWSRLEIVSISSSPSLSRPRQNFVKYKRRTIFIIEHLLDLGKIPDELQKTCEKPRGYCNDVLSKTYIFLTTKTLIAKSYDNYDRQK